MSRKGASSWFSRHRGLRPTFVAIESAPQFLPLQSSSLRVMPRWRWDKMLSISRPVTTMILHSRWDRLAGSRHISTSIPAQHETSHTEEYPIQNQEITEDIFERSRSFQVEEVKDETRFLNLPIGLRNPPTITLSGAAPLSIPHKNTSQGNSAHSRKEGRSHGCRNRKRENVSVCKPSSAPM